MKGFPPPMMLAPLWKRFVSMVCMALLTIAAAGTSVTGAETKKTVAEEILDVLRQNGQITEEQYEYLMEKAKAEGLEPGDFRVHWKEGIRFDSADGAFKLKLGGRIQVDWAYFAPDDELEGAFEDLEGHGVEFRRARLALEGLIYDRILFKTEYDFAGGDAEFKDVYVGMTNLPYLGSVLVGHFKEPFSLEELTSSKYITFMERSLPNILVPSRNMGVGVADSVLDDRMTWAVGAFEETDDFGEAFADFSDFNISARITGVPWYVDQDRLLHLGLSYQHRFRSGDDNPLRFRQRPEAHLTDVRLVDTGDIPAAGADLVDPEVALVYGPFSVQGEYIHAFIDTEDGAVGEDLDLSGFYLFASFFLTGEHRNYDRGKGFFERIRPAANFNPARGGWGAWEVAARYSRLDLSDNGAQGGKEDNYTLALNWYLNPNTRVMFNYIRAEVEDMEDLDDDGSLDIFQSRFQVDF